MGSGRPATMARAWRAADSSRVSETSRGAERDRWHSEGSGTAEVAHGAGLGAAGRSSLGRSLATPLGLKIVTGSAEHCQPKPTATGVGRPAQRLLPAATAGNFRQSFLPSCPGRPRTRIPMHTARPCGDRGRDGGPYSCAHACPVGSCVRCAGPGAPQLFPSSHPLARLTLYAMSGPACPCPALKLASDSPTRVSPTSQAPRER